MSKTLKVVTAVIGWWLILYFGYAFVLWEHNPKLWKTLDRAFCVCMAILVGALVGGITFDLIKTKDKNI